MQILVRDIYLTKNNLLFQIETVIFDCDGVLWKGTTVLPGAIDTVAELRRRGLRSRSIDFAKVE